MKLRSFPSRVISLVPSITELLCYLGFEQRLIGRTKFCIHPAEKLNNVKIIGGTKNPNLIEIQKLQPDLIIGNKEENRKEDILKLKEQCPVWLSDVNTLEQANEMIVQIGDLLGNSEAAIALSNEIKSAFDSVKVSKGYRVLYLIWKKPYMGVGTNAFIHDILGKCGFKNALQAYERYPQLSEKQIVEANPDFVFLSSEPYPFKQSHVEEFERILPRSKVLLVDGELFSWYGSKLLQTPSYVKSLLELP